MPFGRGLQEPSNWGKLALSKGGHIERVRLFLEEIMPGRAIFQPDWPGFDFVFFDCDSTLSSIEGIDELARQKGKFNQVKQLTDAAMQYDNYIIIGDRV